MLLSHKLIIKRFMITKVDINEIIKQEDVSCYGCEISLLPDIIFKKKHGRVEIFSSEECPDSLGNTCIKVRRNWSVFDIHEQNSGVCFLDKKASKVLFAKFPSGAQYVLISLVPRISWFIAFPGFLRQLAVRRVSIVKILKLKNSQSFNRWFVLKNNRPRPSFDHPTLSAEIGVQGFLDYLRNEKIKYVVLRFYENLPDLSRVGGDLDIMVADEDEQRVRKFLRDNPGSIRVDVWSPSNKFDEVTYYPAHLARKILETAVDGPAGSRIPAPTESFLSLAFHALYHRGVEAGIPSSISGLIINDSPKHDYARILNKMAIKLGLDVGNTMEDIDEYLHSQGWRPKFDTLANKMPGNIWIKKRFFPNANMSSDAEIGLGVFILKERAFQTNTVDAILREITKGGRFIILRKKRITGDEQKHVADQLRSGFWTDQSDLDKTKNFLPAMAVVVVNLHLLHCAKTNTPNRAAVEEIKILKNKIRNMFDKDKTSMVHSTDNTVEGWDYVDVCFPSEIFTIKKEIGSIRDGLSLSLPEKTKLHLMRTLYYLKKNGWVLRQYIVNWIMN